MVAMESQGRQKGGPLAGIRVLDLSGFPPGAYCTVTLADMGADILRVEPIKRANQPIRSGGVGLARGKRSMTLDLRHPRAPEVLMRLAANTDVVVEDRRPGELDSLGMGYGRVMPELPSLIWCSVTGWGKTGPNANRPGHDLTFAGHSGLLAALQPELPWHPQFGLTTSLAGLMAAVGVMAAIVERTRTQQGSLVDISLADVGTWVLSAEDGVLAGTPAGIPVGPDRRQYRCSDGRYVSVAAVEPKSWAALCNGVGLPELLDREHVDEATATDQLARIFASAPAAEWVGRLGPSGTGIGAVNQGPEVVHDPHNLARGTTIRIGRVVVPANPIHLMRHDGSTVGTADREPPLAGADTDGALFDVGYDVSEVAELRALGVV